MPVPASFNVLHVSATDNTGGSGRAAYLTHQRLQAHGVRSRMLVGWRIMEDDPHVRLIRARVTERVVDRIAEGMWHRLSRQYQWYLSSSALPGRDWVREADILHIYNLHGGYLSYSVLPRLSRLRPVVWQLDDFWALSGHCIYPFECDRWKTGCGSCPHLSDYPALAHDRTAELWRRKRDVYQRSSLTLVTPSNWLAQQVKASPLLGHFPVHTVPGGLDTEVFHPISKPAAREVLGISPDKQVVLFSAHFISDRRKGAAWFAEALGKLAPEKLARLEILMIGRQAEAWAAPPGVAVRRLGLVQDDRFLATCYSAADVFVSPSMAETFGRACCEAMACGTPCLAFRVAAVPEMVRHMETGYLAAYPDVEDLAKGLARLLGDPELRVRMGRRARQLVEQEYDLGRHVTRMIGLYRELLDGQDRQGHGH